MASKRLKLLASVCLVIGGLLGMAGSFAPPALRGIAWGLDGSALILGMAVLVVHHIKLGNEQLAAGFLVFMVGEALILSGVAMELSRSSAVFGAGAGLWALGLAVVSASSMQPIFVRMTGAITSVLFTVTALRIFSGTALTALSKPLPFDAYPIFVITVFGWAWTHYRSEP